MGFNRDPWYILSIFKVICIFDYFYGEIYNEEIYENDIDIDDDIDSCEDYFTHYRG